MQERICPTCKRPCYSAAVDNIWRCPYCGTEIKPECATRGGRTGIGWSDPLCRIDHMKGVGRLMQDDYSECEGQAHPPPVGSVGSLRPGKSRTSLLLPGSPSHPGVSKADILRTIKKGRESK